MSNICKTVNLYTRKIKGGKMLSYFLDYYPGYRDETTNKVMRHESLGIYIYAHPKTQREKDYNARMSEKAEALRCRRYEEIVNERYEFFDKNKLNGSFIDYFRKHAAKKNTRYEHAFRHFSTFTGGKCTFAEVTVEMCNKFLEYLRTTKQAVHNPIGEEALALIDDGKREGIVFHGFKDSMTQAPLKRWVKADGITKHITYHSSRHTFCSLQLHAGTDVNTVKELVGHKNITTTQQYLDSVDSRKKDAANRITLKRKTE